MPPLQPADHLDKLQDCFSRALPRNDMDEVLAKLDRLEQQSAEGVRRIVRLIAGEKEDFPQIAAGKATEDKALTRRFLMALALAIGLAPPVSAQPYPGKPIRFIVPRATSSAADILTRTVAQKLSDTFGQQIVVDNRAGANGIIGTELVAKAPGDGYTLLAGGTATIAINVSLYRKIPYDPVKDFAPVANIRVFHERAGGASVGSREEHRRSDRARQVQARRATIRVRGHRQLAASLGGSLPDHDGDQYRSRPLQGKHARCYRDGDRRGVAHVHRHCVGPRPYQGGAIACALGQRSQAFAGIAQRCRPPGIPGCRASRWFLVGILAPAGTPAAVVTRLNTEVNRIIGQDDIRDRLIVLGTDPIGGTPTAVRGSHQEGHCPLGRGDQGVGREA